MMQRQVKPGRQIRSGLLIAAALALIPLLAACGSPAAQPASVPVEVTRVVEITREAPVEVTRVVSEPSSH